MVVKKLVARAAIGSLILAGAGLIYLFIIIKDLPDADFLSSRQVFESTKIYDRAGETLLYEIHGEEKRTIIPFDEIPAYMKQATIAIEDEGFYTHSAFSIRGIIRGLIFKPLSGSRAQGGSTITQQLAKNAFLTSQRSITRKLKELVLAVRLEKKFSKDEILNLYLNQIPYGSNAYGIEAAAKTIFDKKAKDLTLAESALLASLPQAPSYYSPWGSHADELMARKNALLEKMVTLGFISEKEKVGAQKQQLAFADNFTSIKAPHFVMMVQDYLNNKYGEDFVRTNGLKVITTLDLKLQESAEKAVAEGAARNQELYEGKNAALVAQDATTGQILALVGSRNYFDKEIEGNFDVATQGLRQPGSAIKPLVYATAFKKGFTPDTTVFDLETEFDATGDPEKSYKPQNFDETFRGPVTLRQALSQSINIPAIKTLYLAGIDNFLKLAKDFGITTLTERSRYGLSLVLGGGEVKLIDLVNAYSVFAQEGTLHKQSFILKVEDDGKVLEEYADEPTNVIDPQYARLINDILSDVKSRAPLFANSLSLTVFPNHEVALKTGTTNDYRDAWSVGYTPSLVVGVWAGNNDNSPMFKKGSSILAAVPIWSAFMSDALKDRPGEAFNKPEPIFVQKPMLNGQYVVDYLANGQKYPQIHDLLYYVDKKDPLGPEPASPENDSQFKNWEEPVLAWAKVNIPNFENAYNKPLPSNAQIKNNDVSLDIKFLAPKNGEFIGSAFYLAADVSSSLNLKKLEVYLNNSLIDGVYNLASGVYSYRKNLAVNNSELQNTLKIVATDELNQRAEKEIILYK